MTSHVETCQKYDIVFDINENNNYVSTDSKLSR